MMEERARFRPHDDFLAMAADLQPIQRFYRAFRLALHRTEGGEVMVADKPLGGLVHRLAIKADLHPPCKPRVDRQRRPAIDDRSEEHTSELQSLMRISYAVFCLKKKKKNRLTYT